MKYNQPYGTGTDMPFINGNPSAGIQGSIIPAEAVEYPQREIVNSLMFGGLTPTNDNLQQLWQAIQRNPWLTHAALDEGTPSAVIASISPSPISLFFGMVVRIKIAHDCTGSSTLNLNSYGAHPIVRANGAATQSGDYLAGEILNLNFDGAAWQIENWTGPPGATSTVNNFTTTIPYSVAGGTANALTGTFTPTILAVVAGNPFLVKASAWNTGPTTLQVDAIAAKPLVWPDGGAMRNGDIRTGSILWIIFDGTNYQVLSITHAPESIGFIGGSGAYGMPDSVYVRPPGVPSTSSLRTSVYSNGVFFCGAGETGWWHFSMVSAYFPGGGGVTDQSAFCGRIFNNGASGGEFLQHNLQHSGNQGNALSISAILYLVEGNQAIFENLHFIGAGAAYSTCGGARIGR